MEKFKIVEFEPYYQEDAKDLLLELQTHLLSLGGLPPKPTFRDEYLPYLLSEIKKHDGKIFLAVKNGRQSDSCRAKYFSARATMLF